MNLQRFPIRIIALAVGMIILNCWSQSHFSNLPLWAFDARSSVSLASTKLTDIKTTSKSTQKLDSWQEFSLLENSTPSADMNNHVFLPYLVNTIKRSYNNPSHPLDSQHTDLVMGISFEYDSSNWVPTLLADNGIESSEGVSIRAIGLANESEGAWLILAAFRNKSELDVNTWITKYDYSRTGVPPTYRMHTLRGFSAVTINEALQVYQGTPPNMRTIVNTGTMVYLIEYASMKPNFLEFELFLKKIQFFLPSSQFSESSLSLTLAESYEKAGKTLYSSPASASSIQSTSVETCCGVTDPEYNPFPCPADGSHGNCTWWVRYRRTGDNRANLALCTGNADTWDFCASQHYPDLLASSPSANAVAAWTTINHVQFIERINSNGSYHISEMNWPTGTSPGTCQREFDQTKTSNIQFIRHPDGGSSCSAPTLNNPGDGQTLSSRTVTFSWQTINGCGNGYTFRIKDTGDMDSGGTTIVDTGEGGTSRTETIPSQYENRDLYWGVRAANATNASWAVRRFRIQPSPTRPTDTPVPASQAKLYNQANFGGSVVWSGNAGFNNEPNANSYSLELPSGWSAKTWRGDNRSGEERCWSGSVNNLQDHGWQNAIQSIEVFSQNVCPVATATFTPIPPTNTPRPPTPTATPIPQSCTNPPPDRNVAYLFENENCVNPWNWSSGHPSDGANRNAKSAWMPNGKVLLLSERNDGSEPRICLSSPVRNLADIGWGNRVEWAEMRDGCPVVQPTATPAGPKHEAKFYEEPNFANQVFTLNSPGTYRYSDLGYVDQFRKFYSVDLCSGCSIQLTNKRGDSICWGWDENNIGDHGDWPLVTVQIKFSYQNECPPREPSLQSPEEGAQFWEGDSVYVVWKDNDDPTSMYFTTEVRYGGTTIAQKYRTTERSLTVANLAPGSYTIQSQSCSDLMCSSWKTRSFSVRMNPTATPTWTPTATDTATPRPTTTPTFTATPSPQPITTSTATATFPTRAAIPSVISPQSELVVGIGEAVTFRWQPLSYPVEYLIYINRNGVRVADSGGVRSNTWTYTFTEPGTYNWTISSLCLGCTEYFSGFSQTYIVYAGGAPTAMPTETPAPSPTSTATPTPEPDCSISIEQGALFTGQPAVRIHAAVPNAAEVQLSNDGGFTGAFWQPYANELTWTLSDPGQKIVTLLVYARFRDAASRPLCSNTALPDDIIYDPLPPTVRIESFTPPAYANAANLSTGTPGLLTVVAEDQAGGSGVTAMRVGYQADLSALPWVPFTAVTQVTEPAGKTIFVEVRDAVGNRSTTAHWSVDSGSSLYLPLIKR